MAALWIVLYSTMLLCGRFVHAQTAISAQINVVANDLTPIVLNVANWPASSPITITALPVGCGLFSFLYATDGYSTINIVGPAPANLGTIRTVAYIYATGYAATFSGLTVINTCKFTFQAGTPSLLVGTPGTVTMTILNPVRVVNKLVTCLENDAFGIIISLEGYDVDARESGMGTVLPLHPPVDVFVLVADPDFGHLYDYVTSAQITSFPYELTDRNAVVYIPRPNFFGQASFQYYMLHYLTALGPTFASAPATVTISVQPVAVPPIVYPFAFTGAGSCGSSLVCYTFSVIFEDVTFAPNPPPPSTIYYVLISTNLYDCPSSTCGFAISAFPAVPGFDSSSYGDATCNTGEIHLDSSTSYYSNIFTSGGLLVGDGFQTSTVYMKGTYPNIVGILKNIQVQYLEDNCNAWLQVWICRGVCGPVGQSTSNMIYVGYLAGACSNINGCVGTVNSFFDAASCGTVSGPWNGLPNCPAPNFNVFSSIHF